MKDIILKLIRIAFGVGLIGYASYLLSQGQTVVASNDQMLNYIVLGAAIVLGVFFLIMLVKPICINRPKITLFILGIFLITFSHYTLQDSWENKIFLADILKILGVFLAIVGPIGFCVPEICKKKKEEAKIEIVEV